MSVTSTLKSMVGLGKNDEQMLVQEPMSIEEQRMTYGAPPMDPSAMQLMSQKDPNSGELGAMALDSDEDIEEFKSMLRGFKYIQTIDSKGKPAYTKISYGIRCMSDDGINYLVGSLRVYSSKNFVLTNFTGSNKDDAIEKITMRVWTEAKKVIILLGINRRKWSIDANKRASIVNHYVDFVEACLYRSFEDGTAKKYWNTQKHITHTAESRLLNNNNEKKGIGSIFS